MSDRLCLRKTPGNNHSSTQKMTLNWRSFLSNIVAVIKV